MWGFTSDPLEKHTFTRNTHTLTRDTHRYMHTHAITVTRTFTWDTHANTHGTPSCSGIAGPGTHTQTHTHTRNHRHAHRHTNTHVCARASQKHRNAQETTQEA